MHKSSNASRPARVLIVDDHPLVRAGLTQLISDEPDLEVCGEAAESSEALRQLASASPDLAIIDISLARGSGIDLIKQIKARDTRVKMLVSSMHDESLFAERALHAGAMGYINKQEATDQVIGAIRQILKGQIYLSARMTERMLEGLVSHTHPPEGSAVDNLSNRELEVLANIGQGLTTRVIAKRLHLSVKTIESHREHIKTKLNLKTANELTRFAMQWLMEQH